MDVIIAIDDDNIRKLQKALFEFGAPTVPDEHFKDIGRIFRMGRSPMRIEILNEASGIDFNACYKNRDEIEVDGISISLISADDLMKNKAASGREKDVADLKNLEGVSSRKKDMNADENKE